MIPSVANIQVASFPDIFHDDDHDQVYENYEVASFSDIFDDDHDDDVMT